jgi:hypothetical protein
MRKFLSTILPDQGVYFVAAKTGVGFAHHPCNSVGDMVQRACQIDAQGRDAYFACASYKQENYEDANGKTKRRTADNAGWAKAFWLDIDCSTDKAEAGKGYEAIPDALHALLNFVTVLGLPKPIVVFSGGGLHVYWPLTETITKERWLPVARQLKALTQCAGSGLIADDSRTSDIASLLRPVGTHNQKPERAGAEVELRIKGAVTDFDVFSQIISRAYMTHCGGSTQPSRNLQLSTSQSTPDPETPEAVARVKSALAAIDPDCEYPLWHDICCAVHALGWSCSEDLARSWSRGDFI